MATVKFNAAVDRQLLKRARSMAAKLGTSVSGLFNAELRNLVETFEAAETAGNHNFRALIDFSLGRVEQLSTMATLGLDSEEDLFLLMAHARLPMPRLSAKATRGMVNELKVLMA